MSPSVAVLHARVTADAHLSMQNAEQVVRELCQAQAIIKFLRYYPLKLLVMTFYPPSPGRDARKANTVSKHGPHCYDNTQAQLGKDLYSSLTLYRTI